MNRTAKAIAIFWLAASPLAAQQDCSFIEGSENTCARIVGCINTDGSHFIGSARGWEIGTLDGTTSNGDTCTGTWTFQAILEKGEGTIKCSNGDSGTFAFFTRNEDTNAISGLGLTEQGNRLRVWSSQKLPEFLAEKFPDGDHPGFQCGDTWIKYPDSFPPKPPEETK